MQKEFKMFMIGELNFFLGLQVKQMEHETFLSQTKYYIKLIKKFGMEKCKETSSMGGRESVETYRKFKKKDLICLYL